MVTRPPARLERPEVREGEARLRLRLGEEIREATFGCRDAPLAANPDAAFVAGLPVAMGLASSLAVPPGVSPGLLRDRLRNLGFWQWTVIGLVTRRERSPVLVLGLHRGG